MLIGRREGRADVYGHASHDEQTQSAHPLLDNCFKCAARRKPKATMVSVGLAYPPVGNTELPAMYRLATSWTRAIAVHDTLAGLIRHPRRPHMMAPPP